MSDQLRISCAQCPEDKLVIEKGDMGLWFEVESQADAASVKVHKTDVEALILVLQHYVETGKLEEVK